MLKKLFVTAAAAAALSVPLAGVASADKPEDPGAGNQGVPDRAAGFVADTIDALSNPPTDGDAVVAEFQSGKSGVVAPGTAYSVGAKTLCGGERCNTPDGYPVAVNQFWSDANVDVTLVGGPFGRTVPGSVTKQVTHGCRQHSTGTCIPPLP